MDRNFEEFSEEVINLTVENAEMLLRIQELAENYSSSSDDERKAEQEPDDEDDEGTEIEAGTEQGEKNRILKTILFLPYNNLWVILQQMAIVTHCCMLISIMGIYRFSSSELQAETLIFSAMDFFFFADLLLSFIYRIWRSLNETNIHVPKPIWQIALAMISLLPLEKIHETFSSDPDWRTSSYYGLHRLLRLNVLYTYIYKSRKSMSDASIVQLWAYTAFALVTLHMAFPMLLMYGSCNILSKEFCNKTWLGYFLKDSPEVGGPKRVKLTTSKDIYILTLYVALSRFTTNGLGCEQDFQIRRDYAVFITITIVSMFVHYVLVIPSVMVREVYSKQILFDYIHSLKVTLGFLKEHNIDNKLIRNVEKNYETCWMEFRGIRGLKIESWIPPVARKGCYLDIFWNAFQHSHLLWNMDVPFLRHLAMHFEVLFFLPGDIICKKNQLKSQMIYVVSGVVQILSEEDDQTPILSFSGGTCLGEATLILSYKSSTILRCAKYCELYVLHRRGFVENLQQYPYHQKSMVRYFQQRITKAKNLQDLAKFLEVGRGINTYAESNVGWLKKKLNHLTDEAYNVKKSKLAEEEQEKEIVGDVSIYDNVQHMVKFLDMYVMPEKLELEANRVFLRGTFPWIFSPTSSFLRAWEKILILTILTMAFLIPHNAAYSLSTSLQATISVLTIILVIDIVFQFCTAVRSQEGMVMDLRTLTYINLTKPSFVIDLVASMPLEICVYLLHRSENKMQLLCTLQLNRLLRLWKIENVFARLEKQQHKFVVTITTIKYFIYVLLLTYFFACILFMETCKSHKNCNPDGWLRRWPMMKSNETNFVVAMFFSSMITTGLGLRDIHPTTIQDMMYVNLAFIPSVLLFIFMITGITALSLLTRKSWYLYMEMVESIRVFMITRKLNKNIETRVYNFLRMQWHHNKGVDVFTGMPKHLKDEITVAMCINALKHVEFFQDVPDKFLVDLATRVQIHLLPEHEVVTYAGSVTREMYIILKGYCEVLSGRNNKLIEVIGPNRDFSSIEMCLEIPEVNTYRTLTNCYIISLKLEQFVKSVSLFPSLADEFLGLMRDLQEIKKDIMEKELITYMEPEQKKAKKRNPSFYYFGCIMKMNSVQSQDYHMPFNKHWLSKYLLEILLMKVVFLPDGLFIKCWEISRVCFAIITALILPSFAYLAASYPHVWPAKYFLDGLAFCDLYVRLHVAYYNKDGLLIKHPLETANHYLKHAFLLDFLACLPVEVFFEANTITKVSMRGWVRLIRILQCHRYLEGIYYMDQEIKVNFVYHLVKYFPLLIVVIHTVAVILMKGTCLFSNDINASKLFNKGVICLNNSWVTNSKCAKDVYGALYPGHVYSLALYYSTSILTRTGLPGVFPQNPSECLSIMFLAFLVIRTAVGFLYSSWGLESWPTLQCVLADRSDDLTISTVLRGWALIWGYFFIISYISIIVGSNTFKNIDLTSYQEEVKTMNHFLERRQIPYNIRKQTVNYFETLWKSKRGNAAHVVLEKFHTSLKYDALYDMYSSSINESSVLSGAHKSFYHSLLNCAVAEFFVKKTLILQVNDVVNKVFILHKGRVEVMGPHNSRLAILYPGSIFGNIRNVQRSRMTVTFVPMSQIEVITIKTTNFHQVLSHYPQMKNKYYDASRLHADFVQSNSVEVLRLFSMQAQLSEGDMSMSLSSAVLWKHIILPDSFLYQLWDVFTLVIGSYITFGIVIYQFCSQDHFYRLFLIGYVFDVLYALKPYIKLRLAYENDVGDMVTSMRLIKRRYIHSFLGLPIDVITIMPLEFIALAVPNNDKWFYFTLLRLNRLPRLLMLIDFFERRKSKLNVNVFLMRFIMLSAWTTLLVHSFICLQILRMCELHNCSTFRNYSNSSLHRYLMIGHEVMSMASTTTFSTIAHFDLTFMFSYGLMAILTQYLGALFLSEMFIILETVTFNLNCYIQTVREMTHSLQKNKLSRALTTQITHYMNLLWDNQRGHQYPRMLVKAPYYLREKVNVCIYAKLLRQNYVFSVCEDDLLRQIVGKMRELTFFPENIVTYEGDLDATINFILKGTVEVLMEGPHTFIEHGLLTAGDVFGMAQGLYPSVSQDFTYRARTKVVLVTLTKSKWDYLLEYFPASKQALLDRSSHLLVFEQQ